MRTSTTFASAFATLCSTLALAGAACAAPAITPEAGATAQPPHVVPVPGVKLSHAGLEELQGRFHLGNGQSFKLSLDGHKMYAKFDGQSRAEVVQVSADTFATRGEEVRIVFDQLPYPNSVAVTMNGRK